ncbi:MAG TPA: hypothetical protein VIF82_00690 [Burkholderiaceae bacterium]|jgi:hypothetical protein
MKLLQKIAALLILSSLISCGGGGGGSDGGGQSTALSFNPNPLNANVTVGTSGTVVVQATLLNPSQVTGSVYVYIEDSHSVLTSVDLSSISSTVFAATLHTSGTLPLGHQTGNFRVHLCKDGFCAAEYPGSPSILPYDLNITPLPLSGTPNISTAATIGQGGQYTGTVTVAVSGPSVAWTASTTAPWLSITGASGTGAGQFTVGYITQNLAVGTYTANVTVHSADNQQVDIPFSVQVIPVQFVMTSGIPSFAAINGAPIASQSVSFDLNNNVATPWTANSLAAWLIASPLSGTTPASITLQPNPSIGSLASGSYSGDLVLSSTGVPNKTVTTSLALTKAALSAPSSSVTIGGNYGRDLSAQSLNVSLNTGTAQWPFTLTGLPNWLTSTTLTGQVNASGTSVNFTPNLANVTAGSQSAVVNVVATVNGDTVTLPITVNINADQRRLLPSKWGVGFANTTGGSLLTKTLAITDNFGGSLNWSATSDAAWLTVTTSGNTTSSQNLILTANPASLTDNAVSYANVTVSTSTTGVQSAVIRVALWKNAIGTESQTTLPMTFARVVADKIRPYVYAHNAGTSISVYNAHTAQLVTTISGVGAALGNMTVSPDGSKLYVLDTPNKTMPVIDLTTLTKVATWTLVNAVDQSTDLIAVRPNGTEIVLLSDRTGYNQGNSLGATGVWADSFSATSNGQQIYNQGTAWNIDYSAMSGGVLLATMRGSLQGGAYPSDVAVSEDGTGLYTSAIGLGGGYRCYSIDPVNLSLIGTLPGGDAYPNNMEVTSDGRPICGISGLYSTYDFWVHSKAGAILNGYKVAGYAKSMLTRQMVVTPDGMIVVALTDDPLIAFVPIGL